jgi:hypothetical protein
LAIGMPGELGIAGFDATMEFCAGERQPAFRADAAAFTAEYFAGSKAELLIRRYDDQYSASSFCKPPTRGFSVCCRPLRINGFRSNASRSDHGAAEPGQAGSTYGKTPIRIL